ncbi:hypothetical protein ACFY7Y_16915 [Streptomyces virginiae]|uniref:hypothetical protein n=1 Tax=Streptomyces virginiae TaxID=1961 RepID=UPI003692D4B1
MSNTPEGGGAHGLSGVAMTLLPPSTAAPTRPSSCRARRSATRRPRPAASVLASTGSRAPEVLSDRSNALGSVHRAIVFDELTAAFCREHPDAVVVSVGIGLDTRAERLAGALPHRQGDRGPVPLRRPGRSRARRRGTRVGMAR